MLLTLQVPPQILHIGRRTTVTVSAIQPTLLGLLRGLRLRLAVTQPVKATVDAERIYRNFYITVGVQQRTYASVETYIPTTITVVWDSNLGTFRSVGPYTPVFWANGQFTDDMIAVDTPSVEWDTQREQFQPIVNAQTTSQDQN
jgi:hypothetical protein